MSETNKNDAPPAVIYVTPTTTPRYSGDRWRNRPQSTAMAADTLIFTSAGMNMALGLGWSQNGWDTWTKQFSHSWFIGVIIGTILSVPLRKLVIRKMIMAASGGLIVMGGILFGSFPHTYNALLAGRYINGIATGLSIVPFLMHASEIAVDTYRGTCLMLEQYSVSIGIGIQMMFSSYQSAVMDFPVYRLHGVFDVVFGFCTFVFLRHFIQSPIECIRKGDDAAALNALSRLQSPQGVTPEKHALLEQHKAYVREQDSLSVEESFDQGFVPMVKMLFFRSLMLAFCFSIPLNMSLKYSTAFSGHLWAPVAAGFCRVLGAHATFIVGDHVNRKLLSVIPVLIIGGLLIALGSIFLNSESVLFYSDMNTAKILYIVLQAFAGFFTPYTSVYMGEAFPLRVKPHLMVVCVIVEQVIQIIFIESLTAYLCIADKLLAQGFIAVVVFVFLCLTMPETRKTTLAEAQRRFRSLWYMKVK